MWIADEQGEIQLARTVRRVPEQQRWLVENLQLVRYVPWNLGAMDKGADGDCPPICVIRNPGARMADEELERIATREPAQQEHNFHILKKDFDKFGYTERCPGCSAILRNIRQQSPHCSLSIADVQSYGM